MLCVYLGRRRKGLTGDRESGPQVVQLVALVRVWPEHRPRCEQDLNLRRETLLDF